MRFIAAVVGVLLLLALIGAAVFDYFLRQQYEPELNKLRADARATVGQFCDIERELAADDFLRQTRTEGDAGPLLNEWLPQKSADMPPDSPLRLPPGMPKSPSEMDSWLTAPPDVSQLDFSWMEKLHAFDRWDLTKEKASSALGTPSPNQGQLVIWTRLRLVKGMRTGELAAASKDVRQLAWLALRTDTLMGGYTAYAILKNERDAYDHMSPPPADWQPMSKAQLARFRALLNASPAYSLVMNAADIGATARSCTTPSVSRCWSLTEAAEFARWMKPLLERDLPESYAALDADIARGGCATTLAQNIWAEGRVWNPADGREELAPEGALLLSRLPYGLVGPRIAGIMFHNVGPGTELPRMLALASTDGGTP